MRSCCIDERVSFDVGLGTLLVRYDRYDRPYTMFRALGELQNPLNFNWKATGTYNLPLLPVAFGLCNFDYGLPPPELTGTHSDTQLTHSLTFWCMFSRIDHAPMILNSLPNI
jgi:hypothetical protein